MGGGEVARYIGKYGSKNVSKAVLIAACRHILLKTADNPEGVDGSVFQGIEKAVAADRYAFFTRFSKTSTTLMSISESASASRRCRPAGMWPHLVGHGQLGVRANLG